MPYACTFCEIVERREPADILYEDDEVMVFRNRLRWVPVMLLTIPKRHMTQAELWADVGRVGEIAVRMGRRHMTQAELWADVGRVGEVAVRMGQEHCARGLRLVSNVGDD